jgi:hypothetical protein
MLAAMKTFEFWRERETGEVWAVELLDGVVVAHCGPLHHSEVDAQFLETFDYRVSGSDEIEAERDRFDLVEPALLGH